MVRDILKQAQLNYPKGTRFISTTGKVKAPLTITFVKVSENYNHNMIVNSEGGVICEFNLLKNTMLWAKIV